MENKIIITTEKGVAKSIYIKCALFEKELPYNQVRDLTIHMDDYKRITIIIEDNDIEVTIYADKYEVKELDNTYIKINEIKTDIENLNRKLRELENIIK
jgi:hypothetical protein